MIEFPDAERKDSPGMRVMAESVADWLKELGLDQYAQYNEALWTARGCNPNRSNCGRHSGLHDCGDDRGDRKKR